MLIFRILWPCFQILRRQVHYLLEQIASGRRTYDDSDFASAPHGQPQPKNIGEADKTHQLPLIALGKESSVHPSGAQTERIDRGSALHPPAAPRRSIFARDDPRRHAAPPRRRDAAAERDAEADLRAAAVERQALAERLWGLEECLAAKDEELSLQRAELDHLRYLVGVKEARPSTLAPSTTLRASSLSRILLPPIPHRHHFGSLPWPRRFPPPQSQYGTEWRSGRPSGPAELEGPYRPVVSFAATGLRVVAVNGRHRNQ